MEKSRRSQGSEKGSSKMNIVFKINMIFLDNYFSLSEFLGVIRVSENIKTQRVAKAQVRGIGEVKVQDDFGGMSKLGGWKPRGFFIHTFVASPLNQVE